MNNKSQLIYRVSTGIFTLQMLLSVSMYLFMNEMVSGMFVKLGFPAWVIYPLAFAKTLGIIAIWTNKSSTLREWAYAGFFFNLILGTSAHIAIGDGEFAGALAALVFLMVSYKFKQVNESH